MQILRGRPLVSICVPTYNGAEFLEEAINSAVAQTVADLEILIVDDSSRDTTLDVARAFAQVDKRIRILQNDTNLGLVGNWNRCLLEAHGTWIKFLFQDDLLEPKCLEELLLRAEVDGRRFIACYRSFIFAEGTEDSIRDYYLQQSSLVATWLGGRTFTPQSFAALVAGLPPRNPIGEPTVTLLHRELIADVGTFDSNFIQLCDAEYWVRASLHDGLAVVPKALATFRVHGGSTTTKNNVGKSYRMLTLDPLVLTYKFLFCPEYALLRQIAANAHLLEDMEFRFWGACHHARRFAFDQSRKGIEQPLSDWRLLARKYPLIGRIPVSQSFRRKLRVVTDHLGS